MKNTLILLSFFVLTFSQSYSQPKYFIFIGVDGMGSYGLKRAHTPVMDSLAKIGSSTFAMKAVYPTLSNPNWASMIMGVHVKEHGIRDNTWRRNDADAKCFCDEKLSLTYPTIFSCISKQDSTRRLIVVHQWMEFMELLEKESLSSFHHAKDEYETIDKACQYLNSSDSLFLFLHLDLVDKAGHTYGLKSQEYQEAIERTDSLLSVLIKYVNAKDINQETLIMISADHGFRGKGHGGRSKKEKLIPFIVAGKGVKKDYRISGKRKICDIAPTIIESLGLKPEECWSGKKIDDLFFK